ncbi:(2Fe-2S) ferredoxin domain-containing protein [Pseudomonas profundi]|uniref:(2Fe-2S) ferredoxin domain-containing protein n=1 Tax=Pseudomonas profundi TaxID=1981513 RepID=UPI001238A23A|nr:(2Fe-2S) ferredoxin domain-containing protein [Pseudomonas profundi]
MSDLQYARVLFAGPDLEQGSFAELFCRELADLRGAETLDDVVDVTAGPAPLWQRVRECLALGELPLLVLDVDPQTSSPQLDWLRSELHRIAQEYEAADQLFVASPREASSAASACELIDQPQRHLDCADVPSLPETHAWSHIPRHTYRVLACAGPRCVRRGALPLWKLLRANLKAAGRLECDGGAHITRTQCQFPCDQGPTLSVYPGGRWYRIANEEDVVCLVNEVLIAGGEVPNLIQKEG